jgi:hypothetical protein
VISSTLWASSVSIAPRPLRSKASRSSSNRRTRWSNEVARFGHAVSFRRVRPTPSRGRSHAQATQRGRPNLVRLVEERTGDVLVLLRQPVPGRDAGAMRARDLVALPPGHERLAACAFATQASHARTLALRREDVRARKQGVGLADLDPRECFLGKRPSRPGTQSELVASAVAQIRASDSARQDGGVASGLSPAENSATDCRSGASPTKSRSQGRPRPSR